MVCVIDVKPAQTQTFAGGAAHTGTISIAVTTETVGAIVTVPAAIAISPRPLSVGTVLGLIVVEAWGKNVQDG